MFLNNPHKKHWACFQKFRRRTSDLLYQYHTFLVDERMEILFINNNSRNIHCYLLFILHWQIRSDKKYSQQKWHKEQTIDLMINFLFYFILLYFYFWDILILFRIPIKLLLDSFQMLFFFVLQIPNYGFETDYNSFCYL